MNLIETLLGIGSAIAEGDTAAAATTAATTDAATTAVTPGIGDYISMFLPMILIFVVFYFFLIRPQRKKDKQVKKMLDNLKVGDRICTIGGIYGAIAAIKDDTITLKVGSKDMPMVVARWAIRSVEEIAIENDDKALN